MKRTRELDHRSYGYDSLGPHSPPRPSARTAAREQERVANVGRREHAGTRLAIHLNRVFGRKGALLDDRYHGSIDTSEIPGGVRVASAHPRAGSDALRPVG